VSPNTNQPDPPNATPPKPTDDAVSRAQAHGHEHGFSLNSVTWGYRDIFAKTIADLFEGGWLGPDRREVTGKFFEMLKQADQSCFDHVLRQFLGALNPTNRWLMDLPGVFVEVVDVGAALAASKLYCGIRYFETLARGGLGRSPQQVHECLTWLKRLEHTDADLAIAFLDGYEALAERLNPVELERYIQVALQIYGNRKESGAAFLRGELSSSEAYILSLTQECQLCDVHDSLRTLLRALAGADSEVNDLSRLDSDELIERGTTVLCLEEHLYLPLRLRQFERTSMNRNWYVLCAVVAAGMLLDDSFPRIHGHPEFRTCMDLVGPGLVRANLFHVVECTRVLRGICRRWPGATSLIALGLRTEFETVPPTRAPERLLHDALDDRVKTPEIETLRRVAEDSCNCFDTAARLDGPWTHDLLKAYPGLDYFQFRPLRFLSDFAFPVTLSEPPSDFLVADLKNDARHRQAGNEAHRTAPASGKRTPRDAQPREEESAETPVAACYLYDEWDHLDSDYHLGWCKVHESRPETTTAAPEPAYWREHANKVRAVFERLKPDLTRREKYLSDGESVDADLLLDYLIARRREPSPPVRFYQKPLINRRDMAVVILLDVSGSTSGELGGHTKVLDVEKHAALVMGQGLDALGDRFAVCGFTSSGREHCDYLIFKDFDDPWPGDATRRILGAWPRNSTRIGPALRHAGTLLARQPCRQRLIILITDGKPMDGGYDPNTGYAQHDVRMACVENARLDVHTFAISTEKNSLADMEIMFPRKRFVILPSVEQLPRVLPDIYLRLAF